MAICSGRKNPNAYDECISEDEMEWLNEFFYGLKCRKNDFKSWKKFNDSSSKMVIDNTYPPLFYLDWINFDDQKES